MKITSLSNPKVKRAVRLRERRAREEMGLTLVDGYREIARARAAGWSLDEVYVCPEIFERFAGQEAASAIASWGLETHIVPEHVLAKICFGDRREGIAALVRVKPCPLSADRLSDRPLVVVIEGVEKPGNLGAIVRSCDGAGVDAVIVADTKADIFNPNVIRASTGTIFSMATMQAASNEVRDFLRQQRMSIIAAVPHARQVYFSADFRQPVAIVFGAEDTGLSRFWMDAADAQVAIPMRGQADSLNVSNTAAVLVYEAMRQRT